MRGCDGHVAATTRFATLRLAGSFRFSRRTRGSLRGARDEQRCGLELALPRRAEARNPHLPLVDDALVVVQFGAGLGHRGKNCVQRLHSNGFSTVTPAFRKSFVFRVATISPCASAVAAMRLSLIGMARPFFFSRASSRAHAAAVAVSKSSTRMRWTPPPNHCSNRARRRPAGSSRMPYSSSPRMTGLTASWRSCRRSQSSARASGAYLVGSLRTLASTRYFTACRWIRMRRAGTSPSRGRRAASPRGLRCPARVGA